MATIQKGYKRIFFFPSTEIPPFTVAPLLTIRADGEYRKHTVLEFYTSLLCSSSSSTNLVMFLLNSFL